MDTKYKAICEVKVNAAADHLQDQLDKLEKSYAQIYNRNQKLEIIKVAADYCLRNGHIDEAAILFTGLDKALEALERT